MYCLSALCKNGLPYRLTERDTYRCEVVIGSSPICCVTDTTLNHKIIVSFKKPTATYTSQVTNACIYALYMYIAVRLSQTGRRRVSNYNIIYMPGPPDPSKTTFHLNGTAIVQELKHKTITIILRDMFENITSGLLCVSIKKVKNCILFSSI